MFTQAAEWIQAQLAAASVSAALDPADLETPGVWITPATWTRPTLDDQLDQVTLDLYLVAGSLPAAAALATLDGLAAQVHAVVRLPQLDAVQVALPNHNPAGLPAYRATVALHITPNGE